MRMQPQPSPEAQQAVNAAMAQSWQRIRGRTAKFLEHAQKDIHDKAFLAGWEAAKRRAKEAS